MEPVDLQWRTSDGLELYAVDWTPNGEPKGVLCAVHGLGDHIGRFNHVAEFMNDSGYAFLGFDLRGHGKSAGKRGHAPSYDALLDDISILLDEAKVRYVNPPKFLYGHSLGGSLVLNYAMKRKPDVAGVIASGPILRPAFDPPAWKITLGNALYSLWPSFTMTNEIDTNGLSRDRDIVEAYNSDPLVHDRISVRLAVDMLNSGEWLLEHADDFKLPLLLMHGAEDPLCSPETTQQFAQGAATVCHVTLWNGRYHEIHNELDKEQIFETMLEWMESQVRKQRGKVE